MVNKMNDKHRTKTRIAVYLIGLRDNQILLGKRQNTNHMNGYWSLVAGHVFEGESCLQAMIREAQEECNLILQPHELILIGAMHHNSMPYDYVNFIYKADLTGRDLQNGEPSKCEQLLFHPLDALPMPVDPYVHEIIKKSTTEKNCWVTEYGW